MHVGRAPAVAVLTPTFNQEDFVVSAIRSVQAQTFTDWEMVVIDDGSADDTVRAAQAEAEADVRVTVLERPHAGLAGLGATYAAGLASTRAPLVAILEGDDEWPPEKLAQQVPLFEDPDIVLSYGAAMQIDELGCAYASYRRRPAGPARENRPLGAILPHLFRQNFIVAATVVIRREALIQIGGFWQPEGIPFVDHPTWLRLAMEGPFAYSSTETGRWRRHRGQFTTAWASRPQPDNREYLREVLALAINRELVVDSDGLLRAIESGPDRQAVRVHASGLRLALLTGSYREIRAAARPLLRTRNPKWVAFALLGLAVGLIGADVEWAFRLTNRFSWPSRRHVSGDRRRVRGAQAS